MPVLLKSRSWGEGELFIGLDIERGQVVACFEAQGRTWGPIDLMEIPEGWPSSRYDYLVDSWWYAFDAKMGGDRFFEERFNQEAAELAYGRWRIKAEAARKVIGIEEAARIADDLIQAFYVEAKRGKTPFDNWALVNKLQGMTFGKFSVDQLMKLLEEAVDRYWKPSAKDG